MCAIPARSPSQRHAPDPEIPDRSHFSHVVVGAAWAPHLIARLGMGDVDDSHSVRRPELRYQSAAKVAWVPRIAPDTAETQPRAAMPHFCGGLLRDRMLAHSAGATTPHPTLRCIRRSLRVLCLSVSRAASGSANWHSARFAGSGAGRTNCDTYSKPRRRTISVWLATVDRCPSSVSKLERTTRASPAQPVILQSPRAQA